MAMTMNPASSVPPGWHYDASMDQYVDSIGRYITRQDADTYGSIIQAIVAIHGSQALQGAYGVISGSNQMASPPPGANGPAGPFTASITSDNTASMGITKVDTRDVISIETKLGRVGINIETGDITVPHGIGRDEAIREFWFGFQKHFQPSNKAKYEEEIFSLKKELSAAKTSAVLMKQENEQQANKRVADKIRKKYNGEKFIMVKPEDLIRFIEET